MTAPPDKKVSVADLARAMRSYYEGTEFDQPLASLAGHLATLTTSRAAPVPLEHHQRQLGADDRPLPHVRLVYRAVAWLQEERRALVGRTRCAVHQPCRSPPAWLRCRPSSLGHMAKLEKRTLFWAVRYCQPGEAQAHVHDQGDQRL